MASGNGVLLEINGAKRFLAQSLGRAMSGDGEIDDPGGMDVWFRSCGADMKSNYC